MFHKCLSQPMWVLSIWASKELTLSLLVWQYQTCPVLIPDVSDICPAVLKLLFSGWFVGSSDGRESRQGLGVPTSRTLTDLEGSLSWLHDQRPTASFQKPWGSEVPTWVGSSDMCREFRHLTNFNSVTWFSNLLRVGSSDSREFRHSSGVPMPHNFTVT